MTTKSLNYIVTANTKGFVTSLKAAGALVVTAFAAAIKITADFERELSKLKGISGATGKDLDKLERQARNLGATTAYTATEVVQLQVELAKLGFSTGEILNSTGGVLDLAAGLGVDLASAAQLTGSTLRAFGFDTAQTGKVVDVLASSATSSALDFEKLRESLSYVAPVAAQLGYSLEETVAMLGKLADSGISGSKAGTSLRQIFLELTKEGITLEQAFERTDFAFNKTASALDLVKKRALPAFLVLKNGAEDTKKLTEGLKNSEGAANKLRLTMEDNAWGDWKKLLSVISDAAITLGQSVDGPLRKALQGLTSWIQQGGLLRLLDKMHILWKNLAIGVLSFGRAIDFVLIAFQKGPTGMGFADPETLARFEKAGELIESYKKQIKEIKSGDTGFAATGGGGGGPVKQDDPGPLVDMGMDLGEVVLSAPKLTEWDKFVKRFRNLLQGMDQFLKEWIESGVTELFVNTFDAIGTALAEGANPLAAAGKAILSTIGNFLKQLGAEAVKLAVLAIGFAKAIAVIKKWIIANPAAAIVAGLALITLGAAFSAAANKSQANISGGGGGGSSAAPTSVASPDLRSIQGSGSRGRNVGGLSTRDGNIVISSDALRQTEQASNRKYGSLGG